MEQLNDPVSQWSSELRDDRAVVKSKQSDVGDFEKHNIWWDPSSVSLATTGESVGLYQVGLCLERDQHPASLWEIVI